MINESEIVMKLLMSHFVLSLIQHGKKIFGESFLMRHNSCFGIFDTVRHDTKMLEIKLIFSGLITIIADFIFS